LALAYGLMRGMVNIALVPTIGALFSENATASVIIAAAVAAILIFKAIGAAVDAYPEWAIRLEAARETRSKGRDKRKRRRKGVARYRGDGSNQLRVKVLGKIADLPTKQAK
jgi:hypothetical protein